MGNGAADILVQKTFVRKRDGCFVDIVESMSGFAGRQTACQLHSQVHV